MRTERFPQALINYQPKQPLAVNISMFGANSGNGRIADQVLALALHLLVIVMPNRGVEVGRR